MKKVLLSSLIVVLLVAILVPALATPKPADAWSGTVTCSPTELSFRVYSGVPTYLLGFIPLDEGQTLTLTHANGGWDGTVAGWTVSDDAGWLNENLLFGVISGSGTSNIIVRVNTDGLTAGTYTAAIKFKFTTCGTNTITVPVTVEVIDPNVLGPLGIGIDQDLTKNIRDEEIFAAQNDYSGLIVNLLTNPDEVMDMQAIETDGSWNLRLIRALVKSDGTMTINGGSLTLNGVTNGVISGRVSGLTDLMKMAGDILPIPPDFDMGQNYFITFRTSDRVNYMGILLGDLPKLLDLLPSLSGLFPEESTPAITETDDGAGTDEATTDLVIPLKPIMNLLLPMMPSLLDLLGNEAILNILKPLMALLPPIMIVFPQSIMTSLMQ